MTVKSPGLVLPDEVIIRLVAASTAPPRSLRLPGVAFAIHTFACRKGDYRLGPFFSDSVGITRVTRRMLELAARVERDSGLMDYGAIFECGPTIEVRHLTAPDLAVAIQSRTEVWTREFAGESELYGSLAGLIRHYRAAPNERIHSAVPVHARWDRSQARVEYEYVVALNEPT